MDQSPDGNAVLSREQLLELIGHLGDDDPSRRVAAAQRLMMISPDSLSALKEAALEARPLSPAQQGGLATVVTHLVLARRAYELAEPAASAIGVTMGTAITGDSAEGSAMGLSNGAVGLPIQDRVPGFDSFAVLREGDVIVSLTGMPKLTSLVDFQLAVRGRPAGSRIDLTIYRDGRRLVVPVRLTARPAAYDTNDPNWLVERMDFAQQIWHDQWEEALNAPKVAAK